jgi:cytochrome c biogenesis protein CcmG/thiol:disulfide interchange protein DsbE
MQRLRLFLPLIVFALLALLLWRGLSLDPNYMPSALEDRPLPEFRLRTLDGRELGTRDLLGVPALLNVWATWCPTCAAEHAYLNELAKQGVPIWGLNYKDDEGEARRWIAERGDPYRANLLDPDGRVGLDLGVTGAPETYVLDARGVVRLRHQGAVDERVWRTVIEPVWRSLQAGGGG